MNRWRKYCLDLRVIFDETQLFEEARLRALSLGFDAFVFALVIPAASLHRPLFRLYGLPPLPSSTALYDAVRRSTRGSMSGVNWRGPGVRESCPWLAALPDTYKHGWNQPTRSLGTEIGVASFMRSYKELGDEEQNALELKMSTLAQTLHAQLMTIIIGRGDLYEPLNVEELAALRWAAQGKTAQETAQLMGVTERRAIYLTQLARTKMRASTTIQAAVRAQGYGLF